MRPESQPSSISTSQETDDPGVDDPRPALVVRRRSAEDSHPPPRYSSEGERLNGDSNFGYPTSPPTLPAFSLGRTPSMLLTLPGGGASPLDSYFSLGAATERNAQQRGVGDTRRGVRVRSRDLAETFRRSVSFSAGVLAGSVRVSEFTGLPSAPRVSRAVFDLSEAAEHIRDEVDAYHHSQLVFSPTKKKRRGVFSPKGISPHTPPEKDAGLEDTLESEQTGREEEVHSPVDEDHIPSPLAIRDLYPRVDRLTVMTFNAGLLEFRLMGVTCYQNPPFARRRLSHIPVALRGADADIIALQEVYDASQADHLVESLRMIYPFAGRRQSGTCLSLHNGLIVLSKFPILRTKFHPFREVTFIEGIFGSKGLLEVCVDIPGLGLVDILNVHLASGAVNPESDTIEALRNEEISQALEIAQAAVQRSEIPLIAGDMNCAPDLCPSNYFSFLENGWYDAFLLARKGFDAQRGGDEDQQRNLVDHHPSWTVDLLTEDGSQEEKEGGGGVEVEQKTSPSRKEGGTGGSYGQNSTDNTSTSVVMKTPAPSFRTQNSIVRRTSSDFVGADSAASTSAPQSSQHFDFHKSLSSATRTTYCTPRPRVDVEEGDVRELLLVRNKTPSRGGGGNQQTSGWKELTATFSNRRRKATASKHLLVDTSEERRLLLENTARTDEEGTTPNYYTQEFTWDPQNPLNVIGPHSGCHGQRCDHIFLPPTPIAGDLEYLHPIKADIIFREPRVMVDGCCFGCCGIGAAMLVTLSDHYAVRVEFRREAYSRMSTFGEAASSDERTLRLSSDFMGTHTKNTSFEG